jgi:hypothetical protein
MKIHKYSQALALISSEGLIADKELKSVIKYFLRTATETNDYHNSVNYRSKEVARRTDNINTKSDYHSFCSKNFRHEHMVPCQVQYELLIELEDKSVESIAQFIKAHSLRATITKEEDALLGKMGFNSKMPQEFYEKSVGKEHLYKHPLARYIASGINDDLELFK